MINVGVYVSYLLFRGIMSLIAFLMNSNINEVVMSRVIQLLSVPASFETFIFQPWSIVTSLFFHISFWHILFNMLMLVVAGRIFNQYLSEKKLILTYLIGGIAGNLLYQIAYQTFPVFQEALPLSMAMGASGSIMAILAAITIYRPGHELFLFLIGKIKLQWIMLIFVLIDLISIPRGNAGGHIAHLGGAMYGAIYSSLLLFHPFKIKKKKKKQKFYTSYTSSSDRPISDEEYNTRKKEKEMKIDTILDKISKYGYEALSKEEKDFLFFASKK
jgi:membrane associated rhomboid family serine protease